MTFDEIIDQIIADLSVFKDQMNAKSLSDDAKLSVMRGLLLSMGGYKLSDHD